MRSCTRAQVGGRKSYGTNCNTFPCHVRSPAGLENSRPRALMSMASATMPMSRDIGFFLCRVVD